MVHKDQFRELEIPAFPEFTVVHLYEAFEGDALLLAHFPDRELQSRQVNRQWAYNVALSVRTTYMIDIINSAINKRVTQKVPRGNVNNFVINEEYRDLLLAVPFIQSKLS